MYEQVPFKKPFKALEKKVKKMKTFPADMKTRAFLSSSLFLWDEARKNSPFALAFHSASRFLLSRLIKN